MSTYQNYKNYEDYDYDYIYNAYCTYSIRVKLNKSNNFIKLTKEQIKQKFSCFYGTCLKIVKINGKTNYFAKFYYECYKTPFEIEELIGHAANDFIKRLEEINGCDVTNYFSKEYYNTPSFCILRKLSRRMKYILKNAKIDNHYQIIEYYDKNIYPKDNGYDDGKPICYLIDDCIPSPPII